MTMRIETVAFDAEPGIRRVREQVFMREQGVPEELEWDGEDAHAIHVIARNDDGEVIGTGRLLRNGHLGRLAVLPPWRGQGVGSALLQALLEAARGLGLKQVYLHAQLQALGFYARHGFKATGNVFPDAGIPHRSMRRPLDAEATP